jgi:uncharacterized protein (TIGR04255 family)
MNTSRQRPRDLPEFESPPLNEVSLGVQFSPAPGYSQIFASEVRDLFKSDFSGLEEHAAFPPTFETFGLPGPSQISFGMVTGARHDRYWFISETGDELLQFQNDRLHHNWRKVPSQSNSYPRFEYMIERYERELLQLETYLRKFSDTSLVCNQAEVTYINHIPLSNSHDRSEVGRWLRFSDFEKLAPNDFSIVYRRNIVDGANRPYARLIAEVMTAIDSLGKELLVLNLTVRGAPLQRDIQGAMKFLETGRDIIVREFVNLTADSAHDEWRRIK